MTPPVPTAPPTPAHVGNEPGGPRGLGLFRTRGLSLWIGLVFVLYALGCLHEAFGPFLFSHDGYNGSAFAQAARNSLRFGVLEQAQYYTGTTPPPLSEIYTNHPMLLHVHLMGLFAVFGVEEWVGRLVPVLYSLGFFVLLYRITARRFSRLTAAIAVTLWALTPLHTIFANMINHEQGGLFWCLLLIERYLIWLERRRGEWSIHLAVTMAMQFDWPGYYFAAFIGLHALVEALSPRRVAEVGGPDSPEAAWAGRPLWARGAFLARFSVVVLINAAAFFGWIAMLRGGLSAMWAAFALRSGEVDGYGALLWQRSLDLYGAGLLALLAAWAVWSAVRVVRGQGRRRDLIPWFFLIAQLIHSTVFKSAGAIHSYWTFYVGPALAIGGASLIVHLWERRHKVPLRFAPRAMTALLVLALGAQTYYAFKRHFWGYANHRAAYVGNASEEWLDVQWAKDLAARYGRDGTCYLIHPSAERRVHITYYLDAPRVEGFEPPALGNVPANLCEGARRIALFDLSKAHTHQVDTIWDTVFRHKSIIWARRFVAVEVDEPREPERPHIVGLSWVEEAPSALSSWLVNSRYAPGHWRYDPSTDWWPARDRTRSRWAGGRTGVMSEVDCPDNEVVTAVRVSAKDRIVGSAELLCRPLHEVLRRKAPPIEELPGVGRLGRTVTENTALSSCPNNAVATGVHGRAGVLVDSFGLVCQPTRRQGGAPPTLTTPRDAPTRGGTGGTGYRLSCPDSEVLTGLAARSEALVIAVSPRCTPLSELDFEAPPEPPSDPSPGLPSPRHIEPQP